MGYLPPVQIAFDGQAPDLQSIADKVAELSSLPISVDDSGANVKVNLYDLHGSFSFTCALDQHVELYSYRPGSVRELYTQMFGDAGLSLPLANGVVGLNEPPETQVAYLRRPGDQELTLFFTTTFALEALGGHPRCLITQEMRQQYATPIGVWELRIRHWKEHIKSLLVAGVLLLLLPVLIPLYAVNMIIFRFKTLPRLRKVQEQFAREYMSKHLEEEGHLP
jgi:hypothetical protein